MPAIKRVLSDIHDSVSQRLLCDKNDDSYVAESFITRINFNRFLGFEPIYTDANIFDGKAFQILMNDPDWTDKLKQFEINDQGEGPDKEIMVACREKSLIKSLISAIRGNNDTGMLSGFSVSLINDNDERERFSAFCKNLPIDSVKDLPSLITTLKSAAVCGEICYETAQQLEEYWSKCSESNNIVTVGQNEFANDFSITKGLENMNIKWKDIQSTWSELVPEVTMSDPAIEYWTKLTESQFKRSEADHIFKNIDQQLKKLDLVLLTLHSLFFIRAYNREISRCNGAAFDENITQYAFPLTKEEKLCQQYIKTGNSSIDSIDIKFTLETFNNVMQVEQTQLDSILKDGKFNSWIYEQNASALEDCLYRLGNITGYNKPKEWPLALVRFIPGDKAKRFYDIFIGPNLEIGHSVSDLLDRVFTTIEPSMQYIGGTLMEYLYPIEKLKRNVFYIRGIIDENSKI